MRVNNTFFGLNESVQEVLEYFELVGGVQLRESAYGARVVVADNAVELGAVELACAVLDFERVGLDGVVYALDVDGEKVFELVCVALVVADIEFVEESAKDIFKAVLIDDGDVEEILEQKLLGLV